MAGNPYQVPGASVPPILDVIPTAATLAGPTTGRATLEDMPVMPNATNRNVQGRRNEPGTNSTVTVNLKGFRDVKGDRGSDLTVGQLAMVQKLPDSRAANNVNQAYRFRTISAFNRLLMRYRHLPEYKTVEAILRYWNFAGAVGTVTSVDQASRSKEAELGLAIIPAKNIRIFNYWIGCPTRCEKMGLTVGFKFQRFHIHSGPQAMAESVWERAASQIKSNASFATVTVPAAAAAAAPPAAAAAASPAATSGGAAVPTPATSAGLLASAAGDAKDATPPPVKSKKKILAEAALDMARKEAEVAQKAVDDLALPGTKKKADPAAQAAIRARLAKANQKLAAAETTYNNTQGGTRSPWLSAEQKAAQAKLTGGPYDQWSSKTYRPINNTLFRNGGVEAKDEVRAKVAANKKKSSTELEESMHYWQLIPHCCASGEEPTDEVVRVDDGWVGMFLRVGRSSWIHHAGQQYDPYVRAFVHPREGDDNYMKDMTKLPQMDAFIRV